MRSTCIALLSLSLIGCSGRDAVRVGVEVRGGTTEQAEALAKAILAELPDTALPQNIGHRLPGVPLDGLALTTSTRTERNHPAGGEPTVKVWLECEVIHRSGVAGANEAADACREELESALVATFGRGSVGSGWKTFSRLSYGLGAVSLEGELELTVDGVTQVARPGMAAIVPSNARHSVRALTDGRAIIVDSPARAEFG